ncbi:hypothetical protein [Leptolyngbya sp. FACHB-17]|uniref:hypothetical protein n=1 Tax=unclassified Leptolyngbya TaxID=2650499 RepID=UPI001F549A77|nr:hypothetical protein [Leptolyngbya sp. FACHB-17]
MLKTGYSKQVVACPPDHPSGWNFLVNLLAGLIAYTYQPKLPSLDLQPKGLPAPPPAIF